MKRLVSILFFLLPLSIKAQNHVLNGDFEYYTACPYTNVGTNMHLCVGWDIYSSSPDYFNTCATHPWFQIPANMRGTQPALSGNAYAGMVSYSAPPGNTNECLRGKITPLTPGFRYEVSLSASLSGLCKYATNGLGVYFYDTGASFITLAQSEAIPAQIRYSTIVSDTMNWVRLVDTFTADSAYDNIAIGRFTPVSNLSIITTTATFTGSSYYYIDSVVVKLKAGIINLFNADILCAGDTFQVPFSLINNAIYNSTNVFSAQLSNVFGSFTSGTRTIGTLAGTNAGSISCVIPSSVTSGNNYHIRIISSNIQDSSDSNPSLIAVGNMKPSKPIATNNGPLCSGDSLKFNVVSAPAITYQWQGTGNFISTLQNPSIANALVAASGQYVVTVYNYGCFSIDTTDVIVHQMPLPVTASSTSPVCENDSLHINCSNSSAGASYIWNGPGGFNTIQQNLFWNNANLSVNGDYIVTATLGTFCVKKDTINVIVKPLPPNLVTGTNSPVCEKDTLHIFASSTDTAVSYSWAGPVSFSSQDTNILKVSLSAAGNYFLSANYHGCIIKDTVTVEIDPLPANVKASSNSPLCAGDSLQLTGATTSNAVVFSWSGPGNFSSTLTTPVIYNSQTTHSGKYFLLATLGNKCSVRDSTTVIIKPMPPKPVIVADSILCAGEILHFNADSTIADASYLWTGPGNFNHDIIAVVVFDVKTTATGTYILTANKDGCIQADTTQVLVKPKPEQPSISSNSPIQTGQNVYFNLSNPQSGVKYTWTGPNGFNSNIINPVLFKPDTNYTGTYFIVADLDGCISTSLTYMQIDKQADTGLIFLYPSPNNGTFYIKGVFKTDQNIPLRIFDTGGNLVYSQTAQTFNKKLDVTIPLGGYLASGEYSLHIMIDGSKRVLRFTVTR